jgi:beta-lactamase regulating signal transducer with metallopeptidase domain
MEIELAGVFDSLWRQTWQIAVLFVLVAVTCRLLRRSSAHVRYLLWLLVLVKCLTPPVLNVSLPLLSAPEAADSVLAEVSAAPVIDDEVAVTGVSFPGPEVQAEPDETAMLDEVTAAAPARALDFHGICVVLWIGGTVLFFLVMLARMIRLRRWLRRHRRPVSDTLRLEIEKLCRAIGLSVFPVVWELPGMGQPSVWGFVRGEIYLPSDFCEHGSVAQRRAILTHEFAHVRRWDAAVNSLQVLAQGLFFFHPLVWWANLKIRREREKCCDEVVLARLEITPRHYSASIVESLHTRTGSLELAPSLLFASSLNHLEERIRTMLEPNRAFLSRPTYFSCVVVLLLGLMVLPGGVQIVSAEKPFWEEPVKADRNTSGVDIEHMKAPRVLQFPADRAIGRLYRMEGLPGKGIRMFAEAKGEVKVPAGTNVLLELDRREPLVVLDELEPDVLQGVFLYPDSCRGHDFSPLARHKSLRYVLFRKFGRILGPRFKPLRDLPALERVDVHHTRMDSAAIGSLAGLTQLRGLDLHWCMVGDSDVKRLTGLTKLEYLDLNRGAISDYCLPLIAKFKKLKTLILEDTMVTGSGFKHLRDHRLEHLGCMESPITDEGLRYLSGMQSLRSMNLKDTAITDRGFECVAELSNLCYLNIAGTRVSEEAIGAFIASHPKCQVGDQEPRDRSVPPLYAPTLDSNRKQAIPLGSNPTKF